MRTATSQGGRLSAPAENLILLAFAAVALMIAAASAYMLLTNTQPKIFFLAYACVPVLCILVGAAFLPERRPGPRVFLLLLFTAGLALKGITALTVTPKLESDFYLLHYAAEQLAQGNNILNDTPYFQLWSYQSFFVALLAGIIKLFGAAPVTFRLMNALFSALTDLLVYALARRFASERAARLAALLFLFYPGTYFLIPVLTNQHLSELLLLAAFWVWTIPDVGQRKRLWLGGVGGILLALSNAVRPMGVVAVLAICACLVLRILEWLEDGRHALWERLLPGLCALAAYFLFGKLLSGLVIWTELNQSGLSNQAPEWKFILGLNQESLGRYSDADAAAVFHEGAVRPQEMERLMKERMSISLPDLLKLMVQKVRIMWGGFEDVSWVLTDFYQNQLEQQGLKELALYVTDKLQRLGSGCYIAIALANAGGALAALRRRRPLPAVQRLLMLTALAYFCAHLFIEIQIRYRSTMTVLLIILAAAGFDWLHGLIRRRKPKEA